MRLKTYQKKNEHGQYMKVTFYCFYVYSNFYKFVLKQICPGKEVQQDFNLLCVMSSII